MNSPNTRLISTATPAARSNARARRSFNTQVSAIATVTLARPNTMPVRIIPSRGTSTSGNSSEATSAPT